VSKPGFFGSQYVSSVCGDLRESPGEEEGERFGPGIYLNVCTTKLCGPTHNHTSPFYFYSNFLLLSALSRKLELEVGVRDWILRSGVE